MNDLRERLLAAFGIEYRDHLEYIRSALGRFESQGGKWDQAELDEVFRRAHSLKGAARAVDLRPVETLAHRLETLFGGIRTHAREMDDEVVAVVHQVANAIEDWVAALSDNATPPLSTQALAAIDALLAKGSLPVVPPPEDRPAATPPPAPEPRPEAPADGPGTPAAAVGAAEDMVRVGTANLDRLLRAAGQLLGEGHGQEQVSQRLRWIEAEAAEVEREWRRLRKGFAPVAGHRAGETLDAFGQRLRLLAREARATRLMQTRSGWNLRRLAGALRDEVRLVRMVPAEHVFAGFGKMIRDLARDEGKKVDFRVTGLQVRADRMVLQTLKDPVMHMLRNAIFHGIEPPEERQAKGKSPVGRVSVRFSVAGNRLALAVEDDGRGIDRNRIIEVAIREGYISGEEVAALGDQDIIRHIFRPGFSTAGRVTDLAGRGMGMSVVYQAVAKLNGSLDIPPRPGGGTLFEIEVPLSIATHRLLMVSCQDRVMAIPTDGVARLLRVAVRDVHSVEGRPVVTVGREEIFLFSLAELIGLPEAPVSVREGQMPVVVLRSGDIRIAVAVDGFLFIRDALVQDLGFPLPSDSKVAGGALMEDGSVVIVISPFQLIEACRQPDRAGRLATAEKAPAKKTPTILVVDDSFTTRTLEKSILMAHGYQVHVAVDGIEALTVLRAHDVDLVVADVQMPRLDGFGLLKEIKRDKVLSKIPVILVTSLESREDRERGLGLGADAYVVKRKFDQRDLLETIEQLL